MIRVAHRRNSLAQLAATPTTLGVEMDVRTRNGRLVVSHDPFQDGPDLSEWLDAYDHALLIVNVKAEGVEQLVLPELHRRGITDFFFLDLTFPAMWRMLRAGERRCAVRVSEYESATSALALAKWADWIWLDCFHGFPVDAATAQGPVDAGFRICLVSPELHQRPEDSIGPYQEALVATGLQADAVCTRHPGRW